MGREELNRAFTKLVCEVGLDGRGARARPRPHKGHSLCSDRSRAFGQGERAGQRVI